jgi:membrane associated rhomboid family serine protease
MNQDTSKPLLGADNNALIALLSINIIVAILLGFLRVVFYLEGYTIAQYQQEIVDMVILYPHQLAQHPWTLFAFNWVHQGFWILFTNMIWLSVFATILQNAGANRHLFPIYFYSSLVAGLVYSLLGAQLPLFGAHIGVISFAIAAIGFAPKERIFIALNGGIPTWIVSIFYLLFTGLSLQATPLQQLVAVVIGGITGLVYVIFLKKGTDLGKWMHQLLHLLNNSLRPK